LPGNKRPNDCDDKASALEKIINWIVDTNPTEIVSYVDKLREQNPGVTATP